MDFLSTALAFIFAISVLVAVHEFGHYWVARRLGVKVLRFSIGFGKPLWVHRRGPDQTEYVIASIPLGGYVKMLDEREGEVAEADRPRAFNQKSLARRAAIVAAGPLFNLLFAVVAYWLMFITGTPGIRPLLGEMADDSMAYQAGLRSGQEIISVGDSATPTWAAVWDALLPYALRKEAVSLEVEDGGSHYRYRLPFERLTGEVDAKTFTRVVGLQLYRPLIKPVLGEIVADSPAARAGLQTGDEIVSINGVSMSDWGAVVNAIRAHPNQTLDFQLRRQGRELSLDVHVQSQSTETGEFGRIGAGVHLDEGMGDHLRSEWRLGPAPALWAAIKKTWDMSALTVRMFGEMIVGRVSTENISGPITIAVYAKSSAVAGLAPFLSFLAIVSISLGILNLLPVPVLDGGHLVFYLVEAVKGKPVSERTEMLALRIGIGLILVLMSLALYNDFARVMGGI